MDRLAPQRLFTLLSGVAIVPSGRHRVRSLLPSHQGARSASRQVRAFSLSPEDLRLSLEKLEKCVDKYRGSSAECLVFYKSGVAVNDLASIRVSAFDGRGSSNYRTLACMVRQGGQ